MSVLPIGIMLISQSLVVYFKKYLKLLKTVAQLMLDNYILGVFTQRFN